MRGLESGERTRGEILRWVREHPGIHKSGLRRGTGLGWGALTYHMRVLEARHQIKAVTQRGKLRLFPADTPPPVLTYLGALQDALPREILRELDREPTQGIQDLSRRFQVSRKIIRRHLTALGEAGLVERSQAYHPSFRVRPEVYATVGGAGRRPPGAGGAGPGGR